MWMGEGVCEWSNWAVWCVIATQRTNETDPLNIDSRSIPLPIRRHHQFTSDHSNASISPPEPTQVNTTIQLLVIFIIFFYFISLHQRNTTVCPIKHGLEKINFKSDCCLKHYSNAQNTARLATKPFFWLEPNLE